MRRAFTLVEVLVVIAIIVLLAAFLLPVLASSRAQARRTACVAQLRQIGMAINLYRQDWNELPQLLSDSYPQYVNDSRLFVCLNDRHRGQFTGNDRLEGHNYLLSGVSYEYFPRWRVAQNLSWYQPEPDFGPGKWEDLTPLVGCPWHWAKDFDPDQDGNRPDSKGWELILTLGGSVRKIRIEEPMDQFTPDRYN